MSIKVKQKECLRCGQCCSRMILEVFDYDIIREPRLASVCEPYKDIKNEFHLGSPCPFLIKVQKCGIEPDTYKCTIYQTRPTMCVAFQPGCKQAKDLNFPCAKRKAGND
jgi:Fe-S-cluster containining protein